MDTDVAHARDEDEDDGKGVRLYQSIYETALRNQVPRTTIDDLIRIYSYDIDFQQAKWDADGRKLQNAVITVRHNGVVIHDNYSITAKTGQGKPEAPEPGPILLQGHGEPVMYRNIWIVLKA